MRIGSRSLLNLVLLALTVVAGGFLYFKPQADPPETFPLVPVAPETVRRIEIERSSGMRASLERVDTGWRMRAPLDARLDDVAVARLLDLARARSSTRLPAADLARFELDRPWARIRFDGHQIGLGMSNPVTSELYALSSEHVHTLPARLAANVPADVSKLLSHRLLGPDEHPVAFRLPRFALVQENGSWRLEPHAGTPSQDDLVRWVDHWRLAMSLVTQPQTDAPVRELLEIDLRDGRTLALRITALTPDLVVRRDDEKLEYHFPARMASVLLAPPGAPANEKP